tara:strand:+ start:499 stop:693 length:195 start_codon:yes stop_codon:yes gene_type:complete
MTFKETLLATIEDNRLEMLMPSREYSEEERIYMRGYNQALEDMLDDYDSELYTINHDKYEYSLN